MSEIKKQKNYIYHGFGFPILLEEAYLHKVRGKWLLKIDIKRLADIVFKILPEKPTGLTGNEIRFARTHLDLSKRKLAESLNISHTAVNKWEKAEDEKASIEPLIEVALRSFFKLQIGNDRGFSQFYRSIMNEAKNFANESNPIRVAI